MVRAHREQQRPEVATDTPTGRAREHAVARTTSPFVHTRDAGRGDVPGARSARLTDQWALQRVVDTAPSVQRLRGVREAMHTQLVRRNASTVPSASANAAVQLNGTAMAELQEHISKIPTYMHEAIWRWVGLLGASAVLAYLTGGGSLLTQAAIFHLPTVGWLATGVYKLVKDRVVGDGLKIGTGPLIEDTFHLATYNFPWWPGTYHAIRTNRDAVADGNYIFILDVSDNFYYCSADDRRGEQARLYVRHSQLAGGAKVKTAGRMRVENGACTLTNESGHYWPDASTLTTATDFLTRIQIFTNLRTEAFVPKKDK